MERIWNSLLRQQTKGVPLNVANTLPRPPVTLRQARSGTHRRPVFYHVAEAIDGDWQPLIGYLFGEEDVIKRPHHACGKSLKAKAELAGKNVKCPQCAQPVLVPAT